MQLSGVYEYLKPGMLKGTLDLLKIDNESLVQPPLTVEIYSINLVKESRVIVSMIEGGCSAGFRTNEALCWLSYKAPYFGPEGGRPGRPTQAVRLSTLSLCLESLRNRTTSNLKLHHISKNPPITAIRLDTSICSCNTLE
jgi:hypothetical protein